MGVAKTTHTLFSRTTQVEILIQAPVESVWACLMNFEAYANWNTAIISLKGKPQVGEKIEIVPSMAPNKVFKLKVKKITINSEMVWGNTMGSRYFQLSKKEGATRFSMSEAIKSPLLPLFVKYIPPFDDEFDKFALSLKRACEKVSDFLKYQNH